jgi:hypothetical protein
MPTTLEAMNARARGYFENVPKIYTRLLTMADGELKTQYKKAYDALETKISKLYAKIWDDDPVKFRNNLYKYGRFEALQKEVADILKGLGVDIKKTVDRYLPEAYRVDYYYNGYINDVAAGLNLGFATVPDKAVKAALAGYYDFSNYKGSVDITINKFNESVKYAVTQATIQGESISKTARNIKKATEISYKNAVRIARTEVLRASSVGGLDASHDAEDFLVDFGITPRRFWMATLDERTRASHALMDGKLENKDGFFVLPGGINARAPRLSGVAEQDINCVIPETPVTFSSGIKRAYKRHYRGEAIRITLKSGITFTVTPNHPILTGRGWLPAHSLKVGNNLIRGNVKNIFFGSKANKKHVPAVASEIFDFLKDLFPDKRVRVTDKDFHGDGQDGDVDIVNVDSLSGTGLSDDSVPCGDGKRRIWKGGFLLRRINLFHHDKILLIERVFYDGDVYNFETENNTYNIGKSKGNSKGIIVHNCRCSVGYEYKEISGRAAMERRAKWESGNRVIPADTSFTKWAKMTDIKLSETVKRAITGKG